MSRRSLVVGNWKMHTDLGEAQALATRLVQLTSSIHGCDVGVCPPYPYLALVAEALQGSRVALGGQDIFFEDAGAFTGAVSGSMLRNCGCHYVLVGHSERRQLFGETHASSQLRMQAAWRNDLIPILCVGETLQDRNAGQTLDVVAKQLRAAWQASDTKQAYVQNKPCVVAYEPVWAIGTGQVATPQQAQAVHASIRQITAELRGAEVAAQMQILYGGSVKPQNAAALLASQDIDGALVGGASLVAEDFLAIVRCALD